MNLSDPTFTNILQIIKDSREKALRQVNTQLIIMYMSIGKVLSEQTKVASYGDDYMNRLSDYIQSQFPGIKGFTRRSLYRMKQFYEAYHTNEQLSDLIPKLSWSSHILILSSCKTEEEREFYLRLSVKENYSRRELERQIDTGYYERFMLSKGDLLPEF